MKRIFLFLLTNLAVVLVLSIVARADRPRHLAGRARPELRRPAGVRRVLWFRRLLHLAGHVQVHGQARHGRAGHRSATSPIPTEQWLLSVVGASRPQRRASTCRKSGIFDSPEPNAFATGARRNAALVAVSSGLLQRMGAPAGRGGARARDDARRQRRHGHAHPGAGRRQHLRDLPLARHRWLHRAVRKTVAAAATSSR